MASQVNGATFSEVWIDEAQYLTVPPEPKSIPGNLGLVGVFYPFTVPKDSIITNYVRCRLCSRPMLKEEGCVAICGRQSCWLRRISRHPAVSAVLFGRDALRYKEVLPDQREEWKRMGELERQERLKRTALGLPGESTVHVSEKTVNRSVSMYEPKEGEPLSKIELEVLKELATNKLYRQIADTLGLRKGSVGAYCFSIYRKLGAQGKFSAIEIAVKRGIITVPIAQLELLDQVRKRTTPSGDVITEKEVQILLCLAEGMSWAQVGSRCNLTTQSAKNKGKVLYEKLGVESALQAVLAAHRRGLISLPGEKHEQDHPVV